MPPHDQKLHELQASLGASAATCPGAATILANQGTAGGALLRKRQRVIASLCTSNRWPQRVLDCIATADHDPLSCSAYLEDAQKPRWEAAFQELWP